MFIKPVILIAVRDSSALFGKPPSPGQPSWRAGAGRRAGADAPLRAARRRRRMEESRECNHPARLREGGAVYIGLKFPLQHRAN